MTKACIRGEQDSFLLEIKGLYELIMSSDFT